MIEMPMNMYSRNNIFSHRSRSLSLSFGASVLNRWADCER
jgi:hypothetical protein